MCPSFITLSAGHIYYGLSVDWGLRLTTVPVGAQCNYVRGGGECDRV